MFHRCKSKCYFLLCHF